MNKFYKNYITDEEIRNATDELAENLLAKILQDKAGDFLALDIKEVDELTEDFEG